MRTTISSTDARLAGIEMSFCKFLFLLLGIAASLTAQIENDYIRCTVRGCNDKATGRELLRFPEVGFSAQQGKDTLFLGETNAEDGVRMSFQVVLRPGVDAVEESVTLSNTGTVRQSYQWWSTAGASATAATRLILPCYLASRADGTVEPWPVKDEVFARVGYRCHEGFVAAYDPTAGFGLAHFADPDLLTGKLVGRTKSQITLKVGLFPDLRQTGVLQPGQSRHFVEYWLPLRELGPPVRVSERAALALNRSTTGLNLALQVFSGLAGARLRVFESDRTLVERAVDLVPGRIFRLDVADAKPAGKAHIQLRDRDGHLVFEHTEDYYDALTGIVPPAKPKPIPPDPIAPAIEAYRAHRFEEALKLLAALPPEPEAKYYSAESYIALGDDAKAQRIFAAIPQDHMFWPVARLELARLLARAGKRNEAKAALDGALQERPDLPGAGSVEIALLRAAGRSAEAKTRLAHWLAMDGADPVLRLEQTKLAGGTDPVWAYLEADPDRSLLAAEAYLELGDKAAADEILKRQPKIGAQTGFYRAFGLRSSGPHKVIDSPVKPNPAPVVSDGKAPVLPDSGPALPRILGLIEAGKFGDALALFNEQTFPKERQPELVRLALLDVRMYEAIELARGKKCPAALDRLDHLDAEDRGIPFTIAGLGSVLKTARTSYLSGLVQAQCGDAKGARKSFERASKLGGVFGQLAAVKLMPVDKAGTELGKMLPTLAADTSAKGRYAAGLVLREAGRSEEANAALQAAAAAETDPEMQHLIRMALQGRY